MSMLTGDIDAEVEEVAEKSLEASEIGKIREFIEEERKKRIEWEVDCFVNEMMKKGRHYVNDKGRTDSRDPHQLRRTVNKFRTMLRRMKNAVTFNDPIVDVLPEVGQEENVQQEELDMASWLCLREYHQNDYPSLIKQAVETAALKTWALVSVTPNDGDDYQERLTIAQTYDSLDVYFDNQDMSKAHRLVISSLEDRTYLEAMGYDVKGINDTAFVSHSYVKQRLEQIGGEKGFTDKILIDQVYMIEYDRDEKDVIKPDTKRVSTYVLAGNEAITQKKTLTGYSCLDELFHVFYLEQDQFDAYNPPWMSDVVPLQRSLNEASENTDTILDSYAKVRWKQRAGDSDNISVLQNKHMQLLRYEGAAPEQVDMPNPPEALFRVMQMRTDQIEDQVGQHGASMGVKEGTQSGRHAALIQAGDQDNMKEPADNLQKLLSWAFKQVLDIGENNIDKVMKLYSPDGEGSSYNVIGKAGMDKMEDEDLKKMSPIPLRAFKNVRVTIVPGSFFTVAQARSDLLELLPITSQLGMKVEGKAMWTVLTRMMNVGLSRHMSRLMEAEEKKIDMQNADWKIAELEFLKMSNGEPVTATPEQDHEVHLRVKTIGLQSLVQKYGQDNDAYWTILQNMNQHYQMMQMKAGKSPEAKKAMQTAEMESQMPPQIQPAPAAGAGGEPLPMVG